MELLIDRRTQALIGQYIPAAETLETLADFFSALADGTRIKIISALSISCMCVGDLAAMLDLNQTTVSHQLQNLRRLGVVSFRRQGKVAFYYLKNKAVLDIMLTATEAM
ncbi:MAG: winged helix-turn-helix transcriptional regulator [Clostridia bacterium]|jgi:DNA-binding transcriptional ArsR family regulator|nr:winged helix-turn-helix transcriptional regulator [Clostridia bacterium]